MRRRRRSMPPISICRMCRKRAAPSALNQLPLRARLSRASPAHLSPRRPSPSIVCVGIVLANLDLFIVNVGAAQYRPRLQGRLPGGPFLGPERLCDRLCRAAGVLRGLADGIAATGASFWGSRCLPRLGRLFRLQQCHRVGRIPRPPGGGRGAHDTDIDWSPARVVSARSSRAARCAPGPRSAALPRHSDHSPGACWSRRAGAGSSSSTFPIGLIAMAIGWWKLPEVPGHDVKRPSLWPPRSW